MINIGILGCGVIGTGVVKLLIKNQELIKQKLGTTINIKKIADINPSAFDKITDISKELFTINSEEVLEDKNIDIIVELIGGKDETFKIVRKAIINGKSIVTANKALLASCGKELFELADEKDVKIGFEASVGAGIPIISILLESLSANQIESIYGIINGTCNYILTKMKEENRNFSDVLKEAQKKGFAEANPSLDIDGIDAAHKLSILSSIAFRTYVPLEKIYTEGIAQISLRDIKYIDELGCEIKLLAIAEKIKGKLNIRVHPTILSKYCLLSHVRGVFNGIYVKADAVGDLMFYGRGAGQFPTASAVVGDIISIAKLLLTKSSLKNDIKNLFGNEQEIMDIKELVSSYYLRFITIDQSGVLASISGILGKNEISIASVIQKETYCDNAVIVMMTYEAKEENLQNALKEIDQLSIIKDKTLLIRVIKNL